jgi:hypothetical protein
MNTEQHGRSRRHRSAERCGHPGGSGPRRRERQHECGCERRSECRRDKQSPACSRRQRRRRRTPERHPRRRGTVRAKGPTPVFVTPMGHRAFIGTMVNNTLLPYANAMKDEATIKGISLQGGARGHPRRLSAHRLRAALWQRGRNRQRHPRRVRAGTRSFPTASRGVHITAFFFRPFWALKGTPWTRQTIWDEASNS